MKIITAFALLLLVGGCNGQAKKPIPVKKPVKLKIVYRDSIYYRTDHDTSRGFLEYRAVNGEKLRSPGIMVHEFTWTMHTTVPPRPPDTTGGMVFFSGDFGSGEGNGRDSYFILDGKHPCMIDNRFVLTFFKYP